MKKFKTNKPEFEVYYCYDEKGSDWTFWGSYTTEKAAKIAVEKLKKQTIKEWKSDNKDEEYVAWFNSSNFKSEGFVIVRREETVIFEDEVRKSDHTTSATKPVKVKPVVENKKPTVKISKGVKESKPTKKSTVVKKRTSLKKDYW